MGAAALHCPCIGPHCTAAVPSPGPDPEHNREPETGLGVELQAVPRQVGPQKQNYAGGF